MEMGIWKWEMGNGTLEDNDRRWVGDCGSDQVRLELRGNVRGYIRVL